MSSKEQRVHPKYTGGKQRMQQEYMHYDSVRLNLLTTIEISLPLDEPN